jgi:predicted ATP-dependent serine protease
MSKYSFGKCIDCGKLSALKDGRCNDCNEKTDIPEFLKNIFINKNDE